MRKLRPNSSTGIITPTKVMPRMTGIAHALAKPSPALINLDKVRSGEPPTICFLRSQGGIGDVMMTLPTIKAAAKKYNCKVDYATDLLYLGGALEKVLRYNPYINKVISWRETDREEYSALVNLTCPCVVHEQPHAPPINRIDLFARHARIPLEDFTIDYHITPEELAWAQELLTRIPSFKKKVLVQPFSSALRRDAPTETMRIAMREMLARDRNIMYIVFTHSEDKDTRTVWDAAEILRLHDYDIRQIAAIMYYCDLVLCPDSAILHMAGALDKPTVTLFGPTDPRARVDHYPKAVALSPGMELQCWPCWYTDNCHGRNLCWQRLNSEEIADTCMAVLNNQPLPQSKTLIHFGNYTFSNPGLTIGEYL